MFDLSFLRKSVASLGQQRAQLRQELEDLQRKREDILTAPATKDDCKQMISAWCAEKSAAYSKLLHGNLALFVRKPSMMQDPQRIHQRMTLFGSSSQLGGITAGPALTDLAMAALMGDGLVKTLHAIVDKMEWPAGALPLAPRAQQVDELDKKIGKLAKEEADLVADARAAGIIFE